MSDEKHTPLPWHIEGPDDFGDYNILHNEGAWAIGAVVSNLNPPEVVAANAELIVHSVNALPVLVKALEDTTRMLEAVRLSAGLGKKQIERLENARAALASVRGAK